MMGSVLDTISIHLKASHGGAGRYGLRPPSLLVYV